MFNLQGRDFFLFYVHLSVVNSNRYHDNFGLHPITDIPSSPPFHTSLSHLYILDKVSVTTNLTPAMDLFIALALQPFSDLHLTYCYLL